MSDLDDILNKKQPKKGKQVQSPLMMDENRDLDLPTLSQEIEKRAKHRRVLVAWFKFFGFIIVLGLLVGIIALIGAYLYCKPRYDLAQTFDLQDLEKLEVASRIVDKKGQELGRIFVQNRQPISIDEVSDHFINALIAAEDGNFYTHDGVDYKGVLRAVYLNTKLGEANQGASTITQQLVRNTFELRDKTISRKVAEAFLARRVEKELGDKQRILELYLNRIYFGSGYYGIEAASEGYFGKKARDLTIVEAATLAGVIRNPYYRSPRKFPDACKKTRDYVIDLMEREDYIDRETMKRAQAQAVVAVDRRSLTGKSGYVYEKVRREVIDLVPADKVTSGGYVIQTTIDSDLQAEATTAMQEQLNEIERFKIQRLNFDGPSYEKYTKTKAAFHAAKDESAILATPKYLQGSMVLIDNESGAIIAQVGGREFQHSQFDRTSQGRYRAGTVFTPFVYAAAFEKGLFPGTLVNDTPINNKMVAYGGTKGILGEWGTENKSNVYDEAITARQALAHGKNAATVRLGMQTGLSNVIGLAEKAGLQFKGKQFNSAMLGSNPASVLEMALAYSVFPNGGTRVKKPHIIASIRDPAGNIVHETEIENAEQRVVDRFTSHQINSILSESLKSGTGMKAKVKYGLGNYPVAAKTGTEYGYTDNWVAGYTSEVTCVAWIGYDKRKEIYPNAFSSETVLPAWTRVMNAAAEVIIPKPFRAPIDADEVEICLESGELACDECFQTIQTGPDQADAQIRCTYTEHLRPGTKVNSICNVHASGGLYSGLRKSNRPTSLPVDATDVMIVSAAPPILPVAPTIIGKDPYNAIKAAISTFVALPVGGESQGQTEVGKNGLPVARPEMDLNTFSDLPGSRVQLPRPQPISFQ